jgi:hypothetical protein
MDEDEDELDDFLAENKKPQDNVTEQSFLDYLKVGLKVIDSDLPAVKEAANLIATTSAPPVTTTMETILETTTMDEKVSVLLQNSSAESLEEKDRYTIIGEGSTTEKVMTTTDMPSTSIETTTYEIPTTTEALMTTLASTVIDPEITTLKSPEMTTFKTLETTARAVENKKTTPKLIEASTTKTTTVKPVKTSTKKMTTVKPSMVPVSTTTSEKPIEVVIKYDKSGNKTAVTSLLNLLNAKIENISTTEGPSSTIGKRPNNKFGGAAINRPSTKIYDVVTPSLNVLPLKSITERVDIIKSEKIVQTTTEQPETTTETELISTTLTPDEDTTTNVPESLETSAETTTTIPELDQVNTTREPAVESKVEPEMNTSTEPTTLAPPTTTSAVPTTTPKPKKENLLSALFSELTNELSNIFDPKKNESKNKNNQHVRPQTPHSVIKPIPLNPSILDADFNYDYVEPTLPPSLPNLKIIPFLPTDAVKKNEAVAKYEYYKPTSYPIITESYETAVFVKEHDLHTSVKLYDPTINYPAITENYEEDVKEKSNIRFNNKYINDQLSDPEFENENGAIVSSDNYSIEDDLKQFMQNGYASGFNKYYAESYDKYGMYPEVGSSFSSKIDYNTENPGVLFEDGVKVGFSPPTKTEGEYFWKGNVEMKNV